MNVFLLQSEATKTEAQEILSVGKNFMSSQDSRPVLAIKQDSMTGGYKLTYGYVPIRKEIFMDAFSHERYPIEMYLTKRNHVIMMYKKEGLLPLVKTTKYNKLENELHALNEKKRKSKADKERMQSLIDALSEERKACEQMAEDKILYNGHTFFSFLLPNDFNYFLDNGMDPEGKPVVIKAGVMFSGTLNKAAMGSACGSLIHHIYKDYGEEKAMWFVSMYQILISFWLQHEGFSIGLEDCIPSNKKMIENEMQKAFLRAQAIITTEKDPDIKEMRVIGELNRAAQLGQKHAKEALHPTNNLVSMIRSGSKGDWFNITQITGLLGQQFVSGKRIEKTFKGRALPYYPKNGVLMSDPDHVSEDANISEVLEVFKGRGFITNCFYGGITAQEFFFHAGGGREGIIDTAQNTASTGYTQRKIIKMIEEFSVSYANTVVNCGEHVVQFDYGGDNLDAAHLINISNDSSKKIMSFMHVAHTVDRLNTQQELTMFN